MGPERPQNTPFWFHFAPNQYVQSSKMHPLGPNVTKQGVWGTDLAPMVRLGNPNGGPMVRLGDPMVRLGDPMVRLGDPNR